MNASRGVIATDFSPATTRSRARAELGTLFAQLGFDTPDLDARILVCAACETDHAGLVRDADLPLGRHAETLAALAARRLAREPVSRILGRREFWGLSFAVTPAVLDPRPETEGLVGALIDAAGGRRGDPLDILDLGTGSGAILAALLHAFPAARGVGIDRAPGACRIARRNLVALGFAARATVVCGVWAEALAARFDLVASNPPYIPQADIADLAPEVRCHDPPQALDGGNDGLDAYRALCPALPSLLKPGGSVALECGAGQGGAVADMMAAAGLRAPSILKDLAGHGRVLFAERA